MTSMRAAWAAFSRGDAPLTRIFRNTGWLLASKFLGAALSLFYLAMVTRSLGPDGFGQFTLVFSLAQAVASLVTFQSWRIVLRFGTPAHLQGDQASVFRLIWFCIFNDLAAALAGCGIVVLLVWLLAPYFHWSAATARDAVVFAFVLLLTIRSTAVGALRLYDRFRDGAAADAATPIMRLLGASLVMLAGPSVNGYLAAWAAGEVVTAAAYWWFVWRRIGPSLRGQSARRIAAVPAEHAGFWRFAWFTNANSTLAAAGQQIALLAVGVAAGPAAAGFFRLAHKLGQALLILADMLSRALYAELARVQAGGGGAAMRLLLKRTNKAAGLAGLMMILVVVLAGRPTLYLIGGAGFLPAFPLLVLLGIAAAVQLIGVSFEPALLAVNRTGILLWIRGLALLGLVVLLAWLLPRLGSTGAAVAMLGDALLVMALLGLAARRA